MKDNFRKDEEILEDLKKKIKKLNLKRCGIFIRYTMPTVLYFVGAGMGLAKLGEIGNRTYEHSTIEYTLGENNSNEPKNEYTFSVEVINKIEVHSPWSKLDFKDSHYKNIFTFDVSSINQDELIKAFEENNEELINNVLSVMPEPTITTIEEDNPININEDFQIKYYIDELTGNVDSAFSLENELYARKVYITTIVIYLIKVYGIVVCPRDHKTFLKKHQFPFSLITHLKDINEEIKAAKEEESELKLSLKQ